MDAETFIAKWQGVKVNRPGFSGGCFH